LTILITGGAGFIGTRLVAALGADADVVLVDNLHPQVHGVDAPPPAVGPNVRFVRGDVTDATMWDGLLETVQPTTIVHLAAETGTGQSLLEASRHTSVNVHGTAVMLDALNRSGQRPEAILLTSSRAVYGEGAWQDAATGRTFYGEPRTATQLDDELWAPYGLTGEVGDPLPHAADTVVARPSNVYAATKLAQENILIAWCASMSVSLSVLRLQNVYGAGQALRNPYTGVLTAFARQALSGEAIEVYEGGGIVRDFVHVSDVVSALKAAIDRPASTTRYRVVDIGSGASDSLLNVASTISRVAGSADVVLTPKYRLGDVRAAYASNAKAAEELDYSPQIAFEDGARELLDWAREEISRAS
jgi:dTDP-L-rhamnose 4-epimerase